MGKASFAKLKDRSGAIQVFLQQQALARPTMSSRLGRRRYPWWRGTLFKTKTGELTSRRARAPAGEVAQAMPTSGTASPTSSNATGSATST